MSKVTHGLMERTVADNGTVMDQTRYFLKDHIGSVLAIAEGNSMRLLQEFHYDVWGKREFTKVYDDPSLPAWDSFGLTGRQGFTGHEMLDNVGLIHMNGRVYDPELGRFVSADPKIPDPYNSQAFNRYAYVYNNPLSFIDPDGFEPVSIAGSSGYYSGDDGVLWGQEDIDNLRSQNDLKNSNEDQNSGLGADDITSIGVGVTPAGFAADVYTAITGEDFFTGEEITGFWRWAGVAPYVSEARKIGKAAKAQEEAAKKALATKALKATDLPVIKRGSDEWDKAVKELKDLGKGKLNLRTETATDAKALLKEARGSMDRRKNYSDDRYKKGNETHNVQNDRELGAGNDLPHIKWKDGKAGGHIYYDGPN